MIDGRTSTSDVRDVHDQVRLDDVVARVAVGTVADVDRAVRAARAAFPGWRDTPAAERVRLLLAAADIVAGSGAELAPQLVRQHGGVLREAQTDFGLGTGVLQHTASLAEEFLRPVEFDDAQSSIVVQKVPRGVAAAIVPWNTPVVLTMMKLVTGNAKVRKPSPFAPAALTLLLQRVAVLLPAGALSVVHGEGDVGAALGGNPLVRKIDCSSSTWHRERPASGGREVLPTQLNPGSAEHRPRTCRGRPNGRCAARS